MNVEAAEVTSVSGAATGSLRVSGHQEKCPRCPVPAHTFPEEGAPTLHSGPCVSSARQVAQRTQVSSSGSGSALRPLLMDRTSFTKSWWGVVGCTEGVFVRVCVCYPRVHVLDVTVEVCFSAWVMVRRIWDACFSLAQYAVPGNFEDLETSKSGAH